MPTNPLNASDTHRPAVPAGGPLHRWTSETERRGAVSSSLDAVRVAWNVTPTLTDNTVIDVAATVTLGVDFQVRLISELLASQPDTDLFDPASVFTIDREVPSLLSTDPTAVRVWFTAPAGAAGQVRFDLRRLDVHPEPHLPVEVAAYRADLRRRGRALRPEHVCSSCIAHLPVGLHRTLVTTTDCRYCPD